MGLGEQLKSCLKDWFKFFQGLQGNLMNSGTGLLRFILALRRFHLRAPQYKGWGENPKPSHALLIQLNLQTEANLWSQVDRKYFLFVLL